ncbi:MAG TPA: hypothetical protein DHW02_22950 [Ktedonobacter sp.]|nr:hypothetical protein [Ktedonobacter sp.]
MEKEAVASRHLLSVLLWCLLPGLLLFAVSLPFFIYSSRAFAANGQRIDVQQACTDRHYGPLFNSNVAIKSDEVLCSDLTAFGGTTTIAGDVQGKIVVFSGNLLIDGNVEGDITLFGSSLTLKPGAMVNGTIYACGTQPEFDAGSHFHGNVVGCTGSISQLLYGEMDANFRFWSLLTWLALGLLLTYLLPEHLMFVRLTSIQKTRRSVVLGLLTVLLSLPVLAILIALIVSIPFAILVMIGLVVAWAMGVVAVSSLIGEYILRRVAAHYNTSMWQVVIGITVLMVVGWLPYIGLLVQIGVGLLGLGAVFLSRFGMRLYSQPKQPL